MEYQEVFSRDEAAKFLRISVTQLDVLAARGQVQRVKLGVGSRTRVLYRREDLLAFLAANVEVRGALQPISS